MGYRCQVLKSAEVSCFLMVAQQGIFQLVLGALVTLSSSFLQLGRVPHVAALRIQSATFLCCLPCLKQATIQPVTLDQIAQEQLVEVFLNEDTYNFQGTLNFWPEDQV